VVQYEFQWQALVNTVMKLRFNERCGISIQAERLSPVQERLCFMGLGSSLSH
jgi:hypothetical protein